MGFKCPIFSIPRGSSLFRHHPGTKFDHLGLLKKPYTMTKGGYMIIKKAGKVEEVFGSRAKEKRFAHRGSTWPSQRVPQSTGTARGRLARRTDRATGAITRRRTGTRADPGERAPALTRLHPEAQGRRVMGHS